LIKEAVRILLQAVPSDIDITEIENALTEHPGVCCVYELHVWSISSNQAALSAHVVLVQDSDNNTSGILDELTTMLRKRFGIDHITIQMEASHDMRNGGGSPYCRAGTQCDMVSCAAAEHDHVHHH
jgi:cobalt-zinc-cadmium efflux system protein